MAENVLFYINTTDYLEVHRVTDMLTCDIFIEQGTALKWDGWSCRHKILLAVGSDPLVAATLMERNDGIVS